MEQISEQEILNAKGNCVWKPNKGKQTDALSRIEFEVGYGGRRGGGKSEGGRGWLLRHKNHGLYRALVLRKHSEDLKDWCDRADRLYKKVGGKMLGNPPYVVFPSGAKIITGHMKDEQAYEKYQGHEYHRILIEELTHIPSESNYLKVISSCRSTLQEIRPQVFTTFNPDGAGFYWVKKRFRLSGIPTQNIVTLDPQTGLKRIFIPAGLSDNPFLDKDPNYKAMLNGLPDGLKQAWLYGSWDDPIVEGGVYTRELNEAYAEGRVGLVPVNQKLRVHTIWDLGISKGNSMSIGFVQRTNMDIRFVDYYQNEGYGLPHYFAKLQEKQQQNNWLYGTHYAPHDIAKRELSTGKSVWQLAKDMGFTFSIVPDIGIEAGILRAKMMMKRAYFDRDRCAQLINGIRNYKRDFDTEKQIWSLPIHDWTSNPADMVRYTAVSEENMAIASSQGQPPRERVFKSGARAY